MLGVLWFAVIRILWNDWLYDPQYSYGPLVPLLVLGLLLKRWVDGPSADGITAPARDVAFTIGLVSASCVALLVPLAEANPEWRPLGGLVSIFAIVLTLVLVLMSGGRSWLRHFAFPILFFLIAVPWPRNFEQWVMGNLMAWNTSTTLEVLHWLGYEAASRGNLILLPCGLLGIEEACSGIRSLQSGLMVALFFGELLRLRFSRRLLLVFLSVLAALFGNVLRSSFLAIMASSRGLPAVAAWHDSAGIAALVLTILPLVVSAFLLNQNPPEGSRSIPEKLTGGITINRRCLLLMMLSMMLVASSLVGSEIWFRFHESEGQLMSWSLGRRGNDLGVSPVAIPEATLRMLFNPEGFSERWMTPSGNLAQVFYFRWPAGRISAQAVAMHNPEVCLGTIGMRMKGTLFPVNATVNGFSIPFRAWLFDQNGKDVYVFHAAVEDGGRHGIGQGIPDTMAGRLERVLAGSRNRGERLVEVAFWNLPDEISARTELSHYLKSVISRESGPSDSPTRRAGQHH